MPTMNRRNFLQPQPPHPILNYSEASHNAGGFILTRGKPFLIMIYGYQPFTASRKTARPGRKL